MEGDWRQALRVLQEMKRAGLNPNLVNHNTVRFAACGVDGWMDDVRVGGCCAFTH